MQADLALVRKTGQIAAQHFQRLLRRILHQQLRLQRHRTAPLRAQGARLARFVQRDDRVARQHRQLGHRPMRLGNARIGLCKIAQQFQHGWLVRMRGDRLQYLQENLPCIRLFGLQHLGQLLLRLVQPATAQQYRSQHPARHRRGRLEFLPLAERLDGLFHVAGFERQLRGAPGHARVARPPDQIGARFHGQRLVSALVGDLGQQEFVQQLVAQFDVGQYRCDLCLRRGLRRRLCRFGALRRLRTGAEQQTADDKVFI
ncbi:MAG: hypothetical protein IPM27_10020 [Nitrosomonadales bacterium]|nr:hypothetical protein [Nitrosomonadales bacterium]